MRLDSIPTLFALNFGPFRAKSGLSELLVPLRLDEIEHPEPRRNNCTRMLPRVGRVEPSGFLSGWNLGSSTAKPPKNVPKTSMWAGNRTTQPHLRAPHGRSEPRFSTCSFLSSCRRSWTVRHLASCSDAWTKENRVASCGALSLAFHSHIIIDHFIECYRDSHDGSIRHIYFVIIISYIKL